MRTFPTSDDLKRLGELQRQANRDAKSIRELYEESAHAKIEMPISFNEEAMKFFASEISRIENSVQDVSAKLESETSARLQSEKEAEDRAKRQARENRIWQSVIVLIALLTLIATILGWPK